MYRITYQGHGTINYVPYTLPGPLNQQIGDVYLTRATELAKVGLNSFTGATALASRYLMPYRAHRTSNNQAYSRATEQACIGTVSLNKATELQQVGTSYLTGATELLKVCTVYLTRTSELASRYCYLTRATELAKVGIVLYALQRPPNNQLGNLYSTATELADIGTVSLTRATELVKLSTVSLSRVTCR